METNRNKKLILVKGTGKICRKINPIYRYEDEELKDFMFGLEVYLKEISGAHSSAVTPPPR
jgi:hypothetical protein